MMAVQVLNTGRGQSGRHRCQGWQREQSKATQKGAGLHAPFPPPPPALGVWQPIKVRPRHYPAGWHQPQCGPRASPEPDRDGIESGYGGETILAEFPLTGRLRVSLMLRPPRTRG